MHVTDIAHYCSLSINHEIGNIADALCTLTCHSKLQLFKTWSGTLQAWRARWSCPGRQSRGGSWLSWQRFSWLGHTPREKECTGHYSPRSLTASPISNCYCWHITSIWSRRSSPEGSNFFIDAFRFIVDQLGKVGWNYTWKCTIIIIAKQKA